MQSLFILGRQPALGLAELESLYGAALLHPFETGPHSATAALLDVEPNQINFDRLGGSIKFAKVLHVLDTTDWHKIESYLIGAVTEHAQYLAEGSKLQLGLSAYGFGSGAGPTSGSWPGSGSGSGPHHNSAGRQHGHSSTATLTTQRLLATGLNLKKAFKHVGHSVRLVPNQELELNSASVLHNNLTGPSGWELLLVRNGAQTILAQTVQVQDITAYAVRDRDRPKRDARVGMLPPKLAQIIINLAVATHPPGDYTDILDPFCGTGVVLQEALLMGYQVVGSDIEQRMIDYSLENIKWLEAAHPNLPHSELGLDDATTASWKTMRFGAGPDGDGFSPLPISFVATETYLGRPFTGPPSPEILNQTMSECNLIIKKFLRNISGQLLPGGRLCLAVPAWQSRPGHFKHLPLIDSLTDMGYNRISFEHARQEELIYFREDQIVARQLLILQKR